MVEILRKNETAVQSERSLAVTGVEVTQCKSGIPLKGWDKVSNALNIFIVDNYLSMGDSAICFEEKILEEVEQVVKSKGCWFRRYDHNGKSLCDKTTIAVNQVGKEDDYILQLSSFFAGKKIEEKLAKFLGVERGILYKNIKVEFEPEGTQFRIDFDKVAERLNGIATTFNNRPNSLNGKEIMDNFVKFNRNGENKGPFVIGVKDGVEVTVDIGRVGYRFEYNYNQGKVSKDRWHVQGATLSGPLDTDFMTKTIPPSISIYIRPESENEYNRLPVVEPEVKSTMNNLANEIAAAFK